MNRYIQLFVSAVITFFLSFIFLVLFASGVTVSVFSGIVEYEVLSGLLPPDFSEVLLYVVIAFEATRCLLVFLQYSDSGDKRYNFNVARGLLISISLVCTLFFCLYGMYNPNEKEVRAEKISQVVRFHDSDVQKLNLAFDKEIEQTGSTYRLLIDEQIDLRTIEKENRVGNQFIGPRYRALQAEIERLENKQSKLLTAIEVRRQSALKALSVSLDNKIKQAEKESHSVLASGSTILIPVLKILHLNKEVPEEHYVYLVVLLSLLFTAGVEGLIVISFGILAKEYGEIIRQLKSSIDMRASQIVSEDTVMDALDIEQRLKGNLTGKFVQSLLKKATAIREAFLKKIKESFNI